MKTKVLYVRVTPEILEKISDIAHAKKLNNPHAINEIFNEYFGSADLKTFIKSELEQTKKLNNSQNFKEVLEEFFKGSNFKTFMTNEFNKEQRAEAISKIIKLERELEKKANEISAIIAEIYQTA